MMPKLENSTLHSLHKSSFHPELGDNEANVTRCRIVATALWHVWRWSNAHCCQGIHSAPPGPRLRTIGYNFAMHLTLNVSWELSSHSTFLWYFTVARILAISFTINYYSQHISGIWRYAEHWPRSLSADVLSYKHCWGLCVCRASSSCCVRWPRCCSVSSSPPPPRCRWRTGWTATQSQAPTSSAARTAAASGR